ncbi:hypothetical protein Tsubulata_032805 [Turnera subulata]|uniref:Uncharacterized protein n=1 Tax=Turnera subulata TaxID=218843 RepID=A0A9Q0JID6_9ROSI|nr:hypothetical protein Tsubulata_032805 [Turnera subulata]
MVIFSSNFLAEYQADAIIAPQLRASRARVGLTTAELIYLPDELPSSYLFFFF